MIAAGSIDRQPGSYVLALRAVNRSTRYVYLTPGQQFLQQCINSRFNGRSKDRWLWSVRTSRCLLHSGFVCICVECCPVLRAYLETMTREAARREALKMLAISNRLPCLVRMCGSRVLRAYLETMDSEAARRLLAIRDRLEADR